jgi:very-short-patch-repair endonuclease
MAAVLACGPGAVASHTTAAALWGIHERERPLHVTTPRHRRARDGIVVHTSPSAWPAATTRHGIPVTDAARTLTDCADLLGPAGLRMAVEAAERAHLVDRRDLTPLPGRRRVVRAPHRFTRSGLERRVLRLIRAAGLPEPETNVALHGWEVDCLWRDRRAVLEVDSFFTHGDATGFERDRRKQNDLEDRGYRVRRVSDVLVDERPAEAQRVITRLVEG